MRSAIACVFLLSALTFPVFGGGTVKSMKVSLSFESQKTDLKMKVFKLPVERAPDAGESEITPLANSLSAMKPLDEGFYLKKGAIQPFLMVVENSSNEPKFFFAVAHTIVPETAGVGFRLGCLCNNHIFEVPPQSRWSRVGTVGLEQYAQGVSIRFNHKIIGITKEEIKEKGLGANVNRSN